MIDPGTNSGNLHDADRVGPTMVLIPLLLLGAALCFPLGLTLPLMSLEKFFVFEETPSLIEVVTGLWDAGDALLAAVIGIFSIVFPISKLVVLFLIGFGTLHVRRLVWLSALGKWSMMDVMLVAIVVFAAKTSGMASAVALPGIWFFGAATLLSAVAALAIEKSARA